MLVAEQIELQARVVLGRSGNWEGLVVIGVTARHLRGSKWEGRVSSKGRQEGRDLDSSQSSGRTRVSGTDLVKFCGALKAQQLLSFGTVFPTL